MKKRQVLMSIIAGLMTVMLVLEQTPVLSVLADDVTEESEMESEAESEIESETDSDKEDNEETDEIEEKDSVNENSAEEEDSDANDSDADVEQVYDARDNIAETEEPERNAQDNESVPDEDEAIKEEKNDIEERECMDEESDENLIDDDCEEDMDDSEDVDENTIISFQEFQYDENHIFVEEKLPIEELTSMMPESIVAYLNNGDSVELQVSWRCIFDYEKSDTDEYVFVPEWDESIYQLSPEVHEILDVPSIYVMIEYDFVYDDDYETEKLYASPTIDIERTDDFEIYLANRYLDYADYFIYDYEAPYRSYVEDLNDNGWFQADLVAWRIATFDAESEAKYTEKEYAYCEAILFDVLYEGEEYTNILTGLNKTVKNMDVSVFTQVCKLDEDVVGNWQGTPEDLGNLYDCLKQVKETKNALKWFGDKQKYVSTFVGQTKSAYDAVDKVVKAEVLMTLPDEVGVILKEMSGSSSSYPALKESLLLFSDICSESLTEEQISLIFVGKYTFNEAANAVLKVSWDQLIKSMGDVGLSITTGQKVGKFASNLLSSTDEVIENYYTLVQLYNFETVLKWKVSSYAYAFKSNPTAVNARKFNTSVKMLFNTYKIGMDYGINFMKSANEGGVLGMLNKSVNKNYQSWLGKTESIQKGFRTYFDDFEEIAYKSFLEEKNLDKIYSQDVIVTDITLDEIVEPLINIQNLSVSISNLHIVGKTVLTEDLSVIGNLDISSGSSLYLNGHTVDIAGDAIVEGNIVLDNAGRLTISGDVLHEYGTLNFDNGTMYIGGDYRIQQKGGEDNAGNVYYISSKGNIVMQDDRDILSVGGDFLFDIGYYNGANDIELSAGTVMFYGNVEQVDSGHHFRSTETNKIYFCGNNTQRVGFREPYSNFNCVQIQNEQVIVDGYFSFGTLLNDCKIISDGAIVKNMNSEELGINVNGHVLEIEGDIVVSDDVDLSNGKLLVYGNLIHDNGRISFNSGELFVLNDYRIQKTEKNDVGEESFTQSSGSLYMMNPNDVLTVKGDFFFDVGDFNDSHQTTEASIMGSGTIYFYGDVKQVAKGNYFWCDGTNRVVFMGETAQRVGFLTGRCYFNEVEIVNNNVVFENYFSLTKLVNDCKIRCENGIILNEGANKAGLNLQGNTLEIEGDITINDYVYFNGGKLIINGQLIPEKNDYYNKHWEKIEVTIGDVNGDEKVNAADRIYLARYLAGWSGYLVQNEAAADVNKDNKVNAADRIYLARYLAGWSGYSLG